MNWWSEAAVLWMPVAGRPGPEHFAEKSTPGADDFYYYALDAFDAVARRRPEEFEREPWVYLLADQKVLSPSEIDQLMDEWHEQMRILDTATTVDA